MPLRYLNSRETAIAQKVFKDSLPWLRIQVTSESGADGSAYTLGRTIKVGPVGYSGMHLDIAGGQLLIHELTHVWQHEHLAHPASYICNAVASYVKYGRNRAYNYQPGLDWNNYNVEQQASLVADWWVYVQLAYDTTIPQAVRDEFAKEHVRRLSYIEDHIRRKHIAPDDDSQRKRMEAATFSERKY